MYYILRIIINRKKIKGPRGPDPQDPLVYATGLEVYSDGVQELPNSHNQELAINELLEMHEEEREIEELESVDQRHSYRRISRINDTGSPSYKGPNMCNFSPTNRVLISKKGSRRNFDTRPPQNSLRQCFRSTSIRKIKRRLVI
ncbi:hypothetical protein TNCV_1192981 [Trichonephila clavipes]|nr:hypothetical protein TNCV_1192981 [Trichonephila clavipes]